MARKESKDNSFADLVARLKEMSNASPDQERAELMEAANKEPKILDDKDISLADIAKLAGIKEYTEQPKVSPKAEKLVESITKSESSITKAIKESDADDSISTSIKKAVSEETNRLDKIAELEAQLAELKTEQKDEQTYDAKSFREIVGKDMQEYIANANENELVELYNAVSDNEAVYNEESSNILVTTPETAEMIADAEKAEQPEEEEVVAEKDDDGVEHTHDDGTKHSHKDGDKDHTHDKDTEGTPNSTVPLEDAGEDVEIEAPKDNFTNDLDPKK